MSDPIFVATPLPQLQRDLLAAAGSPPLLQAYLERLQQLRDAAQFDALRQAAQWLCTHFPACAPGWGWLARACIALGETGAALGALDAPSLAMAPQHYLQCWRGELCLEIGALDRAADALTRALSVADDALLPKIKYHWQRLLWLGVAHGYRDAAISYATRLRQAYPHDACWPHILCSAYQDSGEIAGAFQQGRQAVALYLDGVADAGPLDVHAVPHFVRPEAEAILDRVRAALDAAGIQWCLYAGTLLGVIRDGELLAYDKDLDIAIPAASSRDAVIETMRLAGFQAVPEGANPGEEMAWRIIFATPDSPISLDVFFIHPDGDEHVRLGMQHAGHPVRCRLPRFDFGLHDWRNSLWPVPADPAAFLLSFYGDGWREPDPYFNTVLSNRGRTAASIPVVLGYGYGCLYRALLAEKYAKALSLCAQIQRLQPDPLLDRLAGELRARQAA
ncbi:hypothetical protein SAMN02745857_01863 [Andreprevotia lacus DSM 23236]|jgi:tetratricopeptide (TPR) repeat protein|uniref:LicD family protein n=1 Tax=Andreprevotia lacus DSM 23236 TaxID=1121001 RepID=A0A1W1XK41_9NEIS|nr:hypothetical protein [Andreprevotia lacus]SMC24350.1 hypothetical protein SAMN02745857_01863 [Andreprevotia lacus DSM 23236]